uniref:uncharacterized protein K02A2.6-like n=1 Tax=Styela clava TaxID=7725 RepID=UPI001939FD37|nr:uncharacterized protein K02A2.6-like [Styela clava]
MAELHLPPPQCFLQSPGEPQVPWKRWYNSFETYMKATGLDQENVSADKKRAILLHCLGIEGQRIFASLSDTDTYEQAVAALEKQFGKKDSVKMQRHLFWNRKQHDGESIIEYVAALREIVSECNFADMSDDMICGQIIEHTISPRIRERLLMEPDTLTLDQAVKLACQIETAHEESHRIQKETNFNGKPKFKKEENPIVQGIQRQRYHNQWKNQKANSSYAKQHCTCCGSNSHASYSRNCPAKNRICHACGKRNHFMKMCRSLKQKTTRQVLPSQKQSDDVQNVFSVKNNSDSVNGIFKHCSIMIDGIETKLLIDLGAKISIMNETMYRKLFSKYKLKPTTQKLCGYGGSSIESIGVIDLPNIQYGNETIDVFSFFVTKNGVSLMGVDLFDRLNFKVTCNGATVNSIDFRAKYAKVFTGLGKVSKFQHDPMVDHTVKPISQKLRRLPLSVRASVSAELKRLEDNDVIEKIETSPWISNIVIVPKKNNEIRLCVDLRQVNMAIIPDKYPLPTMTELTSKFHSSTVFSKLDLRRSYEQVPLAKDKRYLTAFITHDSIYQYKRIPYGLCSAPSCFQKILSMILKDCENTVNNIDDVIVHGINQADHDEKLDKVLRKLAEYNLTLNVDKCQFSKNCINFIGYKISGSGVLPLESNVESILNIPMPKNKKELQSFLATTNFYLKFVQNYANVAEPLRKLLRKDIPWEWTDLQSNAVNKLKESIASPPILAHFNPNAQTIVTTDASGYAVGAVLSQIDRQGNEKPVAFASKTLSNTERKYSTCEREALASIYACEHWHIYLYGRKFILRTDHEALKSLLSTSGSGHRPLRIYRWTDRLLQYNFKVEHVSGSKNEVADMLCRLVPDDVKESENKDDSDIFEINLDGLVTKEDLEEESKIDPVFQEVVKCLQNGWTFPISPDVAVFYKLRHELSVWNDVCLARGSRAIIPSQLRKRVLEMAHSGHPGMVRMKQRCRENVWWPRLNAQIEDFVRNCQPCAMSGKSIKPAEPPLQSIPWPSEPWKDISIDVFGEMQIAPVKDRFAVVINDLHSKWPEVALTSNVTSTYLINILEGLFARWGIPESITSDNGSVFVSYEFKHFLAKHGIKQKLCALYNPTSNSITERFNRVLKEGLKTHLREGKTVGKAIQIILQNYRATPHALTGKSPAELMTGRKMRLSLECLKPSNTETNIDIPKMQKEIAIRQQKSKLYTDNKRHAKVPIFKVGDWVRIKRPIRGHKFKSSLSNPHKITRKVGPATYKLEDGSMWNARRLVRSYQHSFQNENDFHVETFGFNNEDIPNLRQSPRNARRNPSRNRRLPSYLQDYELG